MARIRTIKPELFKHEELFDLEKATGLPVRVAFMGLFTCCDREGRFKWRPRALKLDILPYDSADFSRVLDALMTRGFVRKYVIEREEYGVIPTFSKHQVINNKESPSVLPEPTETAYVSMACTREPRVDDAMTTPLFLDQGEGNGREGKGKEQEGKEFATALRLLPPENKAQKPKAESATAATWDAYSLAYQNRYGADPVRNASVNARLAQFVQRLGCEEAPHVARFFVNHNNGYYVREMHAVGPMLKDAEKLRTEWATNTRMTNTKAQQADKTATNLDAFAPLIAAARAKEEAERNQHAEQ